MVLLYGIHEALGSIPALSKPAVVRTCNSSIAEVEAISLSPLHSESEQLKRRNTGNV